jgi:hypothetical protein
VGHTRFFIYFRDDSDIKKLLRDQARIARKWVVAIVHNALNVHLVSRFKERSGCDEIFDIRFFRPEEIDRIVRTSGITLQSIRIEKFGGICDTLLAESFNGIVRNPRKRLGEVIVPLLYWLQIWTHVERIACWIKIG